MFMLLLPFTLYRDLMPKPNPFQSPKSKKFLRGVSLDKLIFTIQKSFLVIYPLEKRQSPKSKKKFAAMSAIRHSQHMPVLV